MGPKAQWNYCLKQSPSSTVIGKKEDGMWTSIHIWAQGDKRQCQVVTIEEVEVGVIFESEGGLK